MSLRRRFAIPVAGALGPCRQTEKPSAAPAHYSSLSSHLRSPLKTFLAIEVRDRLRAPFSEL
jgi:hypothetical protein